jgi:hypothetical protein
MSQSRVAVAETETIREFRGRGTFVVGSLYQRTDGDRTCVTVICKM